MKKSHIYLAIIAALLIMGAAGIPTKFRSDLFRIFSSDDTTKRLAFDVNSITTGTTRTIIMPDADVNLADINAVHYFGDKGLYIINNKFGLWRPDPCEILDVNGAIRLSTTASTNPGTIRWTGLDFEGYITGWVSLTAGEGGGPEHDPCFAISPAARITEANIIDWQAAASWGNHASQNYLDLDIYPNADINSLDDLTKSTNFGGDISGTYDDFVIDGNNHFHTSGQLPSSITYLGAALEDNEIPDELTLAKIINLTINGFVRTQSNDGTLKEDANSYSPSNHNHSGTYEPVLTKGNISAGSAKIIISGSPANAVIGTGVSIDINQANINFDNIADGTNYKKISATNYTDLTDSGDSTLHYHATDRSRANHTGTQLSATISDFNTAADARISNAALDALSNVDTTGATKNKVLMLNSSGYWVDANVTDTFTFSIAKFTWNDTGSTTVEMGPVSTQWYPAGAIYFDATYNNGPPDATPYVDKTSPGWAANLLMTGTGYIGPTITASVTNYPSAINGTRVFTLYAQVGTETSNMSRTVQFKNKKYFGFHSQGTKLDSSQTIFLSNSGWVGTSKNDLDTSSTTLTPTGMQYIHFIYPSRLDPTTIQFYLGGFETDFTNLGTFTFTNASGYSETCRDYVSPQAYDAAIAVIVEATP